MLKEAGNVHGRHLGNKVENLDGPICHGMPQCTDHSFLQSDSMVPLYNRAQLAVQETSVLVARSHVSRNTQATFSLWD